MLEGVMLLWFLLAGLSLLFVAVDIRTTPESPVLKWGFEVVLTASHNLSAGLLKSGNPDRRGALLPGTNSNDFREQRREIPLEIEQRSLDPMKPP